MDPSKGPQILEHVQKSVPITVYDTKCATLTQPRIRPASYEPYVHSAANTPDASSRPPVCKTQGGFLRQRASSCSVPTLATRAVYRRAAGRAPLSGPTPVCGRRDRRQRIPLPQVYELDGADAKLVKEVEKKEGFKCGTFGASGLLERYRVRAQATTGASCTSLLTRPNRARRSLVTGGQGGYIHMWDLENPQKALWEVKGHTGLINAIDGCGGQAKGYGAPEIATCGQDGERVPLRDHLI